MKILTGLLDTPEGRAALDAAAEEARVRDGELLLVAFVPSPHDRQASTTYARDVDASTSRAEQAAERLRADGLRVHVHVPVGPQSPAEAVLRVAEEEDVDLVVIGLRRRSRVGKLVMGSNAQDILLGTGAAVLAVKPRPHEEG
jgi:nucleotide-binding universal stress UspA family protein